MKYRPREYDEIYVVGYDEVFVVEHIREQLKYQGFTYNKEAIFSVRGKETGVRFEIDENMIEAKRTGQVIKRKIDELLDTYNDCVRLEGIFQDGRYSNKANIIMEKLQCGRY